MQGYVPGQDGAFGESRRCFGELEDWLASEDAAGPQHGELEEQLDVRGRALLRQVIQEPLGPAAAPRGERQGAGGGGRRGGARPREAPDPPAARRCWGGRRGAAPLR